MFIWHVPKMQKKKAEKILDQYPFREQQVPTNDFFQDIFAQPCTINPFSRKIFTKVIKIFNRNFSDNHKNFRSRAREFSIDCGLCWYRGKNTAAMVYWTTPLKFWKKRYKQIVCVETKHCIMIKQLHI